MSRMTSNAPADTTNAATKNVKLMTGTKMGLRPYIKAMKEAGIAFRVSHGGLWVAPSDEMMAEVVRKLVHRNLNRRGYYASGWARL